MDRTHRATDGGEKLNLIPGSDTDTNLRTASYRYVPGRRADGSKPLEVLVDAMLSDAASKSALVLESRFGGRIASANRRGEPGRGAWGSMRRSA